MLVRDSHYHRAIIYLYILSTDEGDFNAFSTGTFANNQNIILTTIADYLALEYDDKIELVFSSQSATIIQTLEGRNPPEHLRITSVADINDANSMYQCLQCKQ